MAVGLRALQLALRVSMSRVMESRDLLTRAPVAPRPASHDLPTRVAAVSLISALAATIALGVGVATASLVGSQWGGRPGGSGFERSLLAFGAAVPAFALAGAAVIVIGLSRLRGGPRWEPVLAFAVFVVVAVSLALLALVA